MKEYSIAIVFEATKATGVSLDRLNLGVEPFEHGIGDRVQVIIDQTAQMVLESQSGFIDRLKQRF